MIAVVRISGQVGLNKEIKETLNRLNLRTKYCCVVLENPNPSQLGMIKVVSNFVAFGELDKETYEKLLKERGKKGNRFFRLHPPRGGIDSKKHFGVKKGVLGNNKEEIGKLIGRML
jgi:large subunit ribosomal protein L30